MDLWFGGYMLKRRERQLEGPDGVVVLSARSFDILQVLLERPGEVVAKDELFNAVWPSVMVEENTLQVHVSALRKALDPAFIVTVHGRGYKYAGPAPVAREGEGQPIIASAMPGAGRKPVIAVLPFANLSGDPAQQYFSDGITEGIIDRLSRFRALAVIGQHSAFAFRAEAPDLDAIRNRLRADYIVTGNVRRAGDRLRMAARLSDATTGLAIWAEHYDRPLADIFAVQDELTRLAAATVAKQLEIEIAGRSAAGGTTNFACYEWILRGHWHFNKITRSGTYEAAECYRKALAIESRNAEALGALAVCHSSAWMFDFDRRALEKGIELARQGCEIDPGSAFCSAVLGLALCWTEGLDAARIPLARAVEINPGDWFCLSNRSMLSTYEGRSTEARAFLAQARVLNPIPPTWHREFECLSYFPEGQFAEVLSGVEAIPEGFWDCMYAMACYGHLGLRDKARACMARFEAEGRVPDFMAGAAQEPYRDPDVRERMVSGLRAALSF
ncbi:MAG: winged helix-turn-helix domain-containing protein [Alphaproteobacteria bacterium]|nr:winged helix-turn-helix domain-containing protein [Alphaproteobacteria bacterium]